MTANLFSHGANIVEAQQFDDIQSGDFFMRVVFDVTSPSPTANDDALRQALTEIGERFGMKWHLRRENAWPRVLIMVSQHDHCLLDLLYHIRTGGLQIDLVGVVSNHPRTAHPLLNDNIPYYHLPVTKEKRGQQEAQIRDLVETRRIDLVILARYMQILSNELAEYLAGRCINIHHSFLPGFKGAKPYHQAHYRGVKIIGATAHYVTSDLDEGPIIAQDVEPVTHSDTPEKLVQKGRDIERRVLRRAVGYHVEDRVLINGSRTVVFA